MSRSLAFVVGYAVVLVLFTAASAPAAQFDTAEEAKAMLDRAVARGEGGQGESTRYVQQGRGRL